MLVRLLGALSDGVARLERAALFVLAAAIVGLILTNVVTRSMARAIYWVDELAIYAMIWMVFVGASLALRQRRHVRVSALILALPAGAARGVELVVDALLLALGLFLVWAAWIWYDPLTLARHGFDAGTFAGQTFNFIYDEPTSTLGLRKFWIWLVMPLFAATSSLHAAANLAERLAGLAPDPAAPSAGAANPGEEAAR